MSAEEIARKMVAELAALSKDIDALLATLARTEREFAALLRALDEASKA